MSGKKFGKVFQRHLINIARYTHGIIFGQYMKHVHFLYSNSKKSIAHYKD